MNGLDAFLNSIDDIVWGIPTIVLILATGLLMTIACRGIQFTKSKLAFKSIFSNKGSGHGELTGFAALCTALSATIGTGNIVGVATAIAAGGLLADHVRSHLNIPLLYKIMNEDD